MADIAYATALTSVHADTGAVYTIREGEPWDSSDPIVTGNPGLFTDVPPKVRTSTGWVRRSSRGVEQATEAPGEKRTR